MVFCTRGVNKRAHAFGCASLFPQLLLLHGAITFFWIIPWNRCVAFLLGMTCIFCRARGIPPFDEAMRPFGMCCMYDLA
jgi:hypothetical protein